MEWFTCSSFLSYSWLFSAKQEHPPNVVHILYYKPFQIQTTSRTSLTSLGFSHFCYTKLHAFEGEMEEFRQWDCYRSKNISHGSVLCWQKSSLASPGYHRGLCFFYGFWQHHSAGSGFCGMAPNPGQPLEWRACPRIWNTEITMSSMDSSFCLFKWII